MRHETKTDAGRDERVGLVFRTARAAPGYITTTVKCYLERFEGECGASAMHVILLQTGGSNPIDLSLPAGNLHVHVPLRGARGINDSDEIAWRYLADNIEAFPSLDEMYLADGPMLVAYDDVFPYEIDPRGAAIDIADEIHRANELDAYMEVEADVIEAASSADWLASDDEMERRHPRKPWDPR